MEREFKMVGNYETPYGAGYVIEANTPEERRKEIENFYIPEWIPTLRTLNEKLEAINPNYSISQLKEKFGELTMYTSGLNQEGYALIKEARSTLWFMEHPDISHED